MKNLTYIFIFAFSISKSVSQVNLIYNPSFEFTVSCPGVLGQISASSGWNWNGASADYFHPCTFNNVGVPYNVCGYQQPYSGIAYAGFITYSTFTSNYREYFGTVLTTSLSVGTKYFFSLKTSNSYNPSYYHSLATNNIGIRLFTNNPGGLTPNNNPK